jgi:DNA-binding CsgD family transcriptional regulator
MRKGRDLQGVSGMNVFPYVSPREKKLLRRFAAGKTDREIAADLGDSESRIATQRQRLTEKFEVRTHEQVVALVLQLALRPVTNSKKRKASGRREHRRRPTINAIEIKIMKADGMGPTAMRRHSKSATHLSIERFARRAFQ